MVHHTMIAADIPHGQSPAVDVQGGESRRSVPGLSRLQVSWGRHALYTPQNDHGRPCEHPPGW